MFGLCHWRQELSRVTLAMSFASAPLFLDAAHAADKFFIRATLTAQQTTRYEQGVAKLYDEGGTTVVRVTEVAAPDGRIALDVAVLNRGAAPIDFGAENVEISTADGVPLSIIPYEQLVTKEEQRHKGQRFWFRLAAVGRSLSAVDVGTTYGSGSYSGMSSDGSMNMGTFSFTAQNPAAAADARRDAAVINRIEADALAERQARNMAAYDAVLRTTTVDPGSVAGGTVQFDVPKELQRRQSPVLLRMSVTVNGQAHVFHGQLLRLSK